MGPLVLTVQIVNALIPKLEQAFSGFDRLRDRSRQIRVKTTAIEMIWAEQLHEPTCPDHTEYVSHMEALEKLNQEFGRAAAEIEELGGVVKGVDAGLVDFYGVREGRLVFLCWRRGETEVAFWHHVDEGFGNRRPL